MKMMKRKSTYRDSFTIMVKVRFKAIKYCDGSSFDFTQFFVFESKTDTSDLMGAVDDSDKQFLIDKHELLCILDYEISDWIDFDMFFMLGVIRQNGEIESRLFKFEDEAEFDYPCHGELFGYSPFKRNWRMYNLHNGIKFLMGSDLDRDDAFRLDEYVAKQLGLDVDFSGNFTINKDLIAKPFKLGG
jgi:hypothetical protein